MLQPIKLENLRSLRLLIDFELKFTASIVTWVPSTVSINKLFGPVWINFASSPVKNISPGNTNSDDVNLAEVSYVFSVWEYVSNRTPFKSVISFSSKQCLSFSLVTNEAQPFGLSFQSNVASSHAVLVR